MACGLWLEGLARQKAAATAYVACTATPKLHPAAEGFADEETGRTQYMTHRAPARDGALSQLTWAKPDRDLGYRKTGTPEMDKSPRFRVGIRVVFGEPGCQGLGHNLKSRGWVAKRLSYDPG